MYRGSPANTDFVELTIPCYVEPCKLGTILVLKPVTGELIFAKSTFYQHLLNGFTGRT